MPTTATDYFRYFPVAKEATAWGLQVTAAGFTNIRPNTPYPPVIHPSDHHFGWERGRVLEAFQIVLITAGRGRFESQGTKPEAIATGDAFLLFPGVWHRYRPEPATGWTESWVELRGVTINRLLRQKVFPTKKPVLRNTQSTEIETCLDAVHTRARHPRPGFDPVLAARGLATLAALEYARVASQRQPRMSQIVAEAERLLSENIAEPVNISQLAKQLGVAYSHFRKEFKTHTGYAPWQYMLHLRLEQARRMLISSDVTIEDVADRVGFSSAFHLSTAFKQAYGIAPAHWRRKFLSNLGRPSAKRSATDEQPSR